MADFSGIIDLVINLVPLFVALAVVEKIDGKL